jgi:hypothetical protein
MPKCMFSMEFYAIISDADLGWKPRSAPNQPRTGKGFMMADSVLAEAFPHVRTKKDGEGRRRRAVDLSGKKFGLLTVVDQAPNQICPSGKQRSVWNCVCECGGTKTTAAVHLRTGAVKSCGCSRSGYSLVPSGNAISAPKHRMSSTAEYQSWAAAKKRTTDKNDRSYPRYGGRGIKMSDAWISDFTTFLRDMGPRPPGTSLDRIDNDGPYSRENCRWATRVEQARNRRSTVLFRIGDDERTLTEWSKISGIPEPRIWKRVNTLGWPIERAVYEPILKTWSSRPKR